MGGGMNGPMDGGMSGGEMMGGYGGMGGRHQFPLLSDSGSSRQPAAALISPSKSV